MRQVPIYETGKEKVLCLMAYHLQETFCIRSETSASVTDVCAVDAAEQESKEN